MSIRLYNVTTTIPKYFNGQWKWNEKAEQFEFYHTRDDSIPDCALPAPRLKFGIQFKDYMDEIEENIFRQTFARRPESKDCDVITLQDIKDVAIFSAPAGSYTAPVIEFMHTETYDQFLNDLVIYFEYFLKLVEFLMIRRDEIKSKMRNMVSVEIEQALSGYLVQYRLLLAREYSLIITGSGDTKSFHHLANKSKQSKTLKDSLFFNTVLCFSMRIVWIALHRKSYKIIDVEMNRLFRSGHFNVAEKQLANCPKYTYREQQLLYGPNDFRCNYRNQKSPLVLEILKIKPKNTDVLWIGEQKYRGTDPRMFELELEYVTADAQLSFIDCHHGILGNPKHLYNTMLALDWHSVRKEQFTKQYDPYQLVRSPFLRKPTYENFTKHHAKNTPYYRLVNKKFEKDQVERQKDVWLNRDKIIRSTGLKSLYGENIFQKCANEISRMDEEVEIDRDKIIADFLSEKERKLKK